MTRRTSFLTRCFAMALALVMAFSGSNLGIVLQAFALEPAKASGNMGDLMVQQYGLDTSSTFAKLLLSDDVADNHGYTYNPPTDVDSLVDIDAANRTVTVKKQAVVDGDIWDANRSNFVFDVEHEGNYADLTLVSEEGDNYVFSYDYTGPVYVEIKYNARYAFFPEDQIHLMENIKTLKTGYENVAKVKALGLDKVRAALDTMYEQVPGSEPDLCNAFANAISVVDDLQTTIAWIGNDHIDYLVNEDAILPVVTATAEVLTDLDEKLTVYNAKLNDGIAKLKAEIADAEALLPEGVAEPAELTELKNELKNAEMAAKVFNANQGAIADGAAELKAIPTTGWDVSAAVAENADTAALSALLGGEWSIPDLSYVMIVPQKILTQETGVATLTINGSYSFYKDGEKQTPPAMDPIVIKIAADLDDAGKLVKADPAIASIKEGLADNLVGNGFTAEEVANNFVCDVTRNGDTWNVTYAPKTYTVTIGNATLTKAYGEKLTLDSYTGSDEKIYEYEVVDAEGNVAQYEQGQSITITSDLTITRSENKPYVTNKFYTMVTEQFLKDEQVVADILNSLTTNYTVKYRMPTKGTLLTLADDGTLTMRAADASYGANLWTATGYSIDGGELVKLPIAWNEDKTLTGIEDSVKSIQVIYSLMIASGDHVKAHLGNVDEIIDDAKEEKNALDSLVSSKSDMEALTYSKLGTIAVLADGDANLTEDQQQVFIDMQDNCYDVDKNLKVYNLVVKYENGGLSAFYQDADNFLTTVQQLDTYLGRLFGTTQAEKDGLKAFLNSLEESAGYDDLVSMKESVAKASAALELNALINKDASMSTLGDALALAVKQNKTTSAIQPTALVVDTPDTQPGKNEVTLTIELQAGDTIRSVQKVFPKGITLTAAEMDALVKGQNADFFSGDYAKYYTNNYEGAEQVLNGNKKLVFNWTYKTYTANVGGKAQTFDIFNNTITLPAAPEGQRYEYKIGDVVVPVTDADRTYPISKAEIDALFATGSYTVERTEYKNVTFGFTLTVPGKDAVTVSASYEMEVGAGYTLTADNIKALQLKAKRELGLIQGQYYEQGAYETLEETLDGTVITEDTHENYSWTARSYTVTFVEDGKTVGTATISVDKLTVALPESSDDAVYYEYLYEGETLQGTEHKFLVPGNYTITRVSHANDVTKYDDAANLLAELANSAFIANLPNGTAIKDILTSEVFTTKDVTVADDQGNLSTVKAYDETLKFNIPTNDTLSLAGGILNIPVVTGNNARRLVWNPTKYVFNTGVEGTLTGASQIAMPESVALATVTYEMILANNAKVIEKLAAIDDLMADADKKVAAMDALLSIEGDLSTLSTALKTVDNYTDYIVDDAEYDAVSAIFADMLTNCFTQTPRGGPDKLLLLAQVQKYGTESAAGNGLAYIYANLNDINAAIGNLVMYMNKLQQYPNALNDMGQAEDVKDVIGSMTDKNGNPMTLSTLLNEYSETIAQYQADLLVPGIINKSMDLTAFGQKLQALSVNYTTIADAEAVKDQVVVLSREAVQIGEGVLVAEVVLSVEGYSDVTIIAGPYETATGSYTLTAADLADLNGKISAALANLTNFNANYYATDYKTITALTIDGDSEALAYSWTLKPVKVADHEGNLTDLAYTLAGTTMEIELPAAPAGWIYEYFIGADKYEPGVNSISIKKLYDNLGTDLVIKCEGIKSVDYTIKLVVEGIEETVEVKVSYPQKVVDGVGQPVNVDKAAVNTAIIVSLAELNINADLYTTDYAQNNLVAVLTENTTSTFNWTYKNFKVTINDVAHEEINLGDLEITLPAPQDPTKVTFRYVIDGETITVTDTAATYTFTKDQLSMLFENGTYNIKRREIKVDDGVYETNNSLLTMIGASALLENSPAAGILSSGALYEEEFVRYNAPKAADLLLEEGVLTVEEIVANANAELNWIPVSYQMETDAAPVKITTVPTAITMDPVADYVDVNYELVYASKDSVNEKLALADALVADAKEQKETLDYLSSANMLDKLGQLNQSTMQTVITAIESGNFSANAAESESHKAYYLTVFNGMANNCYADGELILHGLLSNYATAGMGHFYQNAATYKTEVTRLGNYLEEMMVPEHKAGLQYFMNDMGFGSYYDMFADIQQTISDSAAAMTLNEQIDTSKNLAPLVTALEEALVDYTNVAGTGTDMVATATLQKANDGRVTLEITLKADGTPNTGKISATYKMTDGGYTIQAADLAKLQAQFDAKAAELKFNTGDFAKYYVQPDLSDLVGKTVTLDDYAVEKVWTYKNYTVNVGGEKQTINLGNLTITLPKSDDANYRNDYIINGVTYTEDIGSYTFKKADLDTLFGENGEEAFEITVNKINKAEAKLNDFVNGLNAEVGAGSFTLVGPEGDRTGIVANIPADGLMGMFTYMMMGEYPYVGLNNQALVSEGIHMQTLMDAVLSDAKFGNQTIINIGNGKPGHLLDATMQLGIAADDLQYTNLTFTINITSVPSNMKANVETIANALEDLKNVIWFNGNPETGKLDVHVNMGPAKIDGKNIDLEKLYEAYLTALLVTYDMQKTTLDEMNQIVAVQILKDYTACLAESDVTIRTLENTLAKLGQNIDLSKYENYFKLMQKFHRDSVVAEDGTSLTESFLVNDLITLSGMDVSAYAQALGMIYEHKNNVDLTVGVNAILENANKTYEAVILDPKNSSVQNKFDYTLDLSKRANSINGQSVIMLLSDVDGDVVLNNATILDLNGYSINGKLTAKGRTIIIDSANGGYVKNVTGNATILAGSYGNDVSAMLRPGYTFSNGVVSVDITSMLTNGYFTSVPFVAAEMAIDLALNKYASAAFYACASTDGSADLLTIYELGFDDFIGLIDQQDSLKQNAVNIVNTILEMITLDGGLDELINQIAALLIDVDRIVELTKNGGTLGVLEIGTRTWKVETKHIHDEDYLTVGWTVNPDAPLKHGDIAVKIPAIENSTVQRVFNELADIAAGTAGAPESYFKVDLKDITLADNTVNIGGGLQTFISLNFCGDDDGETDLTYHGTYNRMLAVLVAFFNDDLTKDIIKNGEIAEINELMAATTVGDFFNTVKRVVNSDKPFDFMAEKVGAKLTAQELAKLSKAYEKFQAGAAKVLAKFEAKAPLNATPMSFLVDNNGVLLLQSATYSGTKGIEYRGYGLNFELTDSSVGLKIKFCTEDSGYKLVFRNPNGDAATDTVMAGKSFFINDVEHVLTEDGIVNFGDSLPAWFDLNKAGGNLAITYTYSETTMGGQTMLTPEQMFIWVISPDKTDSTGKTFKAVRAEELDNILDYAGCSVWLSNSGVNGLQYHYTLSDGGVTYLAGLGYDVVAVDNKQVEFDHGTVIDWKYIKETGELNPNKGVIREGDARYDNSEVARVSDKGTFYGQAFPAKDEKLVRDQNIRFYLALEKDGEEFILYSGLLERDIKIVAEMVQANDTEVEPYKTYVNKLVERAAAYAVANPNVK